MQWTTVYFIPRTFHFPFAGMLECRVQSADSLPQNRFQSVKANFLHTFSDSRKKFICRPELLSLKAAYEMPKQNPSTGVKSSESGGWGGCDAIRKKLSSQNALVTFVICGLALSACMHDQRPFTCLSTPSNDLGENISDIVGGREHLSFWHGMIGHGINNLESTGISDEHSHQFRALNHVLLLIGDLISHLHLAARSSHLMICRQIEP
jgi:hypothetical protein